MKTLDTILEPLLPSLKDDHNVTTPDAGGQWQPRSAEELKNIADGLKIHVPTVQVNSIPTAWARPLLFEMALFDRNHVLYEVVVGEWRGMLAMLALSEIRSLRKLSVLPVSFRNKPTREDQLLHNSLERLLPRGSIASDTSWRDIFVFLYNERSIGITSPTTLVATATNYVNRISHVDVPWFNGKILVDPTKITADGEQLLSESDRAGIAGWIENLRSSLRSHPDPNLEYRHALNSALDDFQRDLNFSALFVPSLRTLGIEGPHAGAFVYLNKPARPTHEPTASHVQLIASPERNPARQMLIVDKNIATVWGMQARNICVWENFTLANIDPINGFPNDEHHVFNGVRVDEVEFWTPDALFTTSLCYIDIPNAFPGTWTVKWIGNKNEFREKEVSVLPPVNKKLLEYYTSAELIDRMEFEQTGDNITVRIRLTLSATGQNRDYTIQKVFSGSDQLKPLSQVPILDLFPRFNSATWKTYFLAYSADNIKATFQATPLNTSEPVVDITPRESPNAKRCIWKLDSPPEAIVCFWEGKETGLLLLQDLEPTRNANRKFKVGVDFGASGSSVFASNGEEKFSLSFENQKLEITLKSEAQRADVTKFFLPEETVALPFLSLFQDFGNASGVNLRPLLEGHVYYYNKNANSKNSTTDLSDSTIISDLKWSEDAAVRRCVSAFLEQVCIQTCAELGARGAAQIEWKFSYPTAFPEAQIDRITRIWEQIVREVQAISGIICDNPTSQTESVAAATYFRRAHQPQALTVTGVVFIDIGGSTSDISLWQEDALIWQASVLYAGRNILLDYLKHHLNIFDALRISADEVRDAAAEGRKASVFYAEADSFLHFHREAIFNALPFAGPVIDHLKNHLVLGLSGLFYYVGLGVRALIDEQKYLRHEMPQLFIGGNGSQIFRWLADGGAYKNDNAYTQLFSRIFKAAVHTELTGSFRLNLSAHPKQEAAHGLILAPFADQVGNQSRIFAGEDFRCGGEEHQWSEELATMRDRERISSGNPDKLADFIVAYNDASREVDGIFPITFEMNHAETIRGEVANTVSDMNKPDAPVEPIFIIELKHLLSMMTREGGT